MDRRLVLALRMLAFMAALAWWPGSAAAQTSCDAFTRGSGEDLKCRTERALLANEEVWNKFKEQLDGSCFSPRCDALKSRLDRVKSLHGKAKNAHARSTPDDFKGANGRRSQRQGQPDDPGPPVDDESSGDMSDQLQALELALLDASSEFGTPVLAASRRPIAIVASGSDAGMFQGGTLKYDYLNDPEYPDWLHQLTVPVAAQVAMLAAVKIADSVEGGAKYGCLQTAVAAGFGGNASVACVAFGVARELARGFFEYAQFVDGDTDSWTIKGAYERSGQAIDGIDVANGGISDVRSRVSSLSSQLSTGLTTVTSNVTTAVNSSAGNLELNLRNAIAASTETTVNQINTTFAALTAQISALSGQVQALQDQVQISKAFQRQILKFLLVPEGTRELNPALLGCTGSDCPVILVCPSAGCGFPLPMSVR